MFVVQNLQPRVHLTESDFAVITDNGRLCTGRPNHLGPVEFEHVMRRQLQRYSKSALHLNRDKREIAQRLRQRQRSDREETETETATVRERERGRDEKSLLWFVVFASVHSDKWGLIEFI